MINSASAYYFWLKSADNTPEDIQRIELQLDIKLPIVSFIFDPRDENDVLNSIDKIVEILWTDRIYHFTISPDNFSAAEVAMWSFDEQYTAFFNKVKEKNLHVIFRTMHEMNGWWYPRSSNPDDFKAAWIHVWTLSREVWLGEENIVFDFSINHRDMPTKFTPSQSAPLTKCTITKKNCYHFEDYYPWDSFVDVVGFSFYNRWKAMWDRKWLSPIQILYDKDWKTYTRVLKLWKPIIIDEVATTSVRYKWKYDFNTSRQEYLNHNERKDTRLRQLWEFIINRPEIIAALYFNSDYTHWLQSWIIWEADWAIVNIDDNKIYNWFWDLELFWEKSLDDILDRLFNISKVQIGDDYILASPECVQEMLSISSQIDNNSETINDKINMVSSLRNINFNSPCITKALDILSEMYQKDINYDTENN